jgi:hypothetical protein
MLTNHQYGTWTGVAKIVDEGAPPMECIFNNVTISWPGGMTAPTDGSITTSGQMPYIIAVAVSAVVVIVGGLYIRWRSKRSNWSAQLVKALFIELNLVGLNNFTEISTIKFY